MSKKFGFDLLRAQVLDQVESDIDYMIGEKEAGDTEIEKLFFLALMFRIQFGGTEYSHILRPSDAQHEARLLESVHSPQLTLLVRSQAQIDKYRVDFLIHALDVRNEPVTDRVWRRLVVECDGHQYHERTKEQAAKDRSRDRWLTAHDYDVFRFTGSELWRDPMACAEQVTDWALKGWF